MLILKSYHEIDVCHAGVARGVESVRAVQGDDIAGPSEKKTDGESRNVERD
jgi:hypothetical protein